MSRVRGVGYARWTGKVEILEGGTHHFDLQLQKASRFIADKGHRRHRPTQRSRNARLVQHRFISQSVQPLQASDKALASWLFQQNAFTTNEGTGDVQFTNLLPGRYQIRVTFPIIVNP